MGFDPVAYINQPRWRASRLGLERMRELLERLGRPQDRLRFAHVAGTNGKGSVCAYLASILQESGYRTGLFTSPYIEAFEERIRVDGENIGPGDLAEATAAVAAEAELMVDHPTEFELMFAVALVHFARKGCDIAVLEVGLGGRCDATNVVPAPEVCVLTRIGLDHTEELGGTLSAIAREKAGIVKEGSRVVSWPHDGEVRAVIEDVCARRGTPLVHADFSLLTSQPLLLEGAASEELPLRRFRYLGRDYRTALIASYQPCNAALAIDAAQALRDQGWGISPRALADGIANARWPGRFEVAARDPLVIVDGGHNPQGARALVQTLREVLPGREPVFVVGVLADKDYRAMLDEVAPLGRAFVAMAPDSPRALPTDEAARAVREALARAGRPGVEVRAAADAEDALRAACGLAGGRGAVCAFGSLYSIGSVKGALRRMCGRRPSGKEGAPCTD